MTTNSTDRTTLIQEVTTCAFCATVEQLAELLKAAKRRQQEKRTLFSARKAAEVLECHVETVRRYAREGLLTPLRIGKRKVRFDASEIYELANGEKGAA